MDNKKISSLVLIDLLKAFDSISHSILLKKLSYIGASQDTVEWFRSYLTGRAQKVRIWVIQTNDLPTVTQTCDLNSFVHEPKKSLSFPVEEMSEAKHKLETGLTFAS